MSMWNSYKFVLYLEGIQILAIDSARIEYAMDEKCVLNKKYKQERRKQSLRKTATS